MGFLSVLAPYPPPPEKSNKLDKNKFFTSLYVA